MKDLSQEYISLNAVTKIQNQDNTHNFYADKQAVDMYFKEHVEPNTKKFSSIEEKIGYLIENDYYDEEVLDKYDRKDVIDLFKKAKEYNFKFLNFMGAYKFYNSYCLKSFDGKYYLEEYTDRVSMNALLLAKGNIKSAYDILDAMLKGIFQPATPTFLNAGKKKRGEYVSCYLVRVEDNMESISRAISTSLQLSKRGGGVALCLTNLREFGAPIKKIQNQCTGIVPVMKLLEDSFSYANQLGQRQGAGAVYLNVHHPEVMTFLDTKRENADEKIRIKSLALGLVIPDITFTLAKNNEDMALFSPYDIQRVYGVPMSDISITKEYYNLLKDDRIKKTYISARKLFQTIAELHFESGYPYILFDDTVNMRNPQKKKGRIVMSNLCSEIAQVNTISTFKQDLSFENIGEDVCCNLGSINIAKMMENACNMEKIIDTCIVSLDSVSRLTDIDCAPSIRKGNEKNHAVGLGAMNLHGFLATNEIYYASNDAVDFTDAFFYALAYYAFKASNKLAKSVGVFEGFEDSEYATGEYFKKYTEHEFTISSEKVKNLLEKYMLKLPTKEDWIKLAKDIKESGLANAHLLAVAPTGSISYVSSCTPSLQPVVSPIEVRKEGKLGRVYVPAYMIDDKNYKYYEKGAYEIGPEWIIDVAAAAAKHVDQAISLTLFMTDKATTRDLNKAYIRAFSKKCPSIYYVRIRQDILEGSEDHTCTSCVI